MDSTTGKPLPTCNRDGLCKHEKPKLTLTIPANAMELSQAAWPNTPNWDLAALDSPASPASPPGDQPQQSSLDEILQAMVVQEAREAWAEEACLKWAGDITRPLPPVLRGDEEEVLVDELHRAAVERREEGFMASIRKLFFYDGSLFGYLGSLVGWVGYFLGRLASLGDQEGHEHRVSQDVQVPVQFTDPDEDPDNYILGGF